MSMEKVSFFCFRIFHFFSISLSKRERAKRKASRGWAIRLVQEQLAAQKGAKSSQTSSGNCWRVSKGEAAERETDPMTPHLLRRRRRSRRPLLPSRQHDAPSRPTHASLHVENPTRESTRSWQRLSSNSSSSSSSRKKRNRLVLFPLFLPLLLPSRPSPSRRGQSASGLLLVRLEATSSTTVMQRCSRGGVL
jgi:hypothetical protein